MKCSLGIFSLALFFIAGWAEESGVVNIDPEGKVRFAKVGDSLNIDCYVLLADKDKSHLKWAIPTSHNVDISARTDLKTMGGYDQEFKLLRIKRLEKNNFGTYKCSFKTSSASFELHLFTEEKRTDNFTYGEMHPAELSCNITVVDLQVEKVEWLKNDTLVTDLDDHKRFIQVPEKNTLRIMNPERTDTDLYIARFHFENSSATHDCAVPYTGSPFLVKFDKSKNLIEGDDLDIRCDVKGYPRDQVVWMKDGKELNMDDHERMVQGPLGGYNNASLLIKSVTFEDAGDYSCKVHSELYNMTYSASLIVRVKDKLAALWPFLGIVCEVIILCIIIFIYEKRHNKQAESEANNVQDVDGSATDKKEGLRHRNTQSNNPTA